MDGLSLKECFKKVEADWPIYMLADLAFWPFFQYLNFRFVSLNFQATAVNAACLFWNVVMSAIESRIHSKHEEDDKEQIE